MPAHGTEVDERAERALAALREGRPPLVGDRGPGWTSDLRSRAEALILDEHRLWVAAAAVMGAVLIGTMAWFALRPTSSSAAGSSDAFFATPATTTVAEGAASGPSTTEAASGVRGAMVVHAAGAVAAPGVYPLAAGARVADLLAVAGGPTLEADLDRLNLAAPLADGQRVYVPRRGEVAPPTVGPDAGGGGAGGTVGATGGAGSAPIDLNTASAEELDALPGVGPATARAIIDHRAKNGPFAAVDDLLDVRGIGPAKLEGLRDLVAVQ